MYKTPEYEAENSVQIKIPWDTNTARGFVISLVFMIVFLLITPVIKFDEAYVRPIEYNTVPIVLLNFGDGDGTGLSKGNLTQEGAKQLGAKSTSPLEDASKAVKTKLTNSPTQSDILTGNLKAVNELSSDTKNKNESEKGIGTKEIGSPDGLTDGSGLGNRGIGRGAGYGFGDIEWGGGGNRIVLHKPLPRFPSGVNTNAELRFRFTVLPDGTVGKIIPLQKADPKLEQAAMEALRQWRFNPLKQDIIMEGIIPLTFVLR